MRTIPYGYKLQNGKPVIAPKEAAILQQFFSDYISGMSLANAAKKAGFPGYHRSARNKLTNRHYLGDEFYPAIIAADTFTTVQELLYKRAAKLGRLNRAAKHKPITVPTEFMIAYPTQAFRNPLQNAEYLYSLIYPKEANHGTKQNNDNTSKTKEGKYCKGGFS